MRPDRGGRLGHQLTFDAAGRDGTTSTAGDWGLIPSPKLSLADNRGPYSWSPLYTAFSERFASAAIALLQSRKRDPTVFDPFVGGGTTLLAALSLGLRAV